MKKLTLLFRNSSKINLHFHLRYFLKYFVGKPRRSTAMPTFSVEASNRLYFIKISLLKEYKVIYVLFLISCCLCNFSGLQAQSGWDCPPIVANPSTHLFFFPDTIDFNINCLNVGDFIGAFHIDNGQEVCNSTVSWEDKDAGITVFGDDPETPEKEGFSTGEAVIFKVWNGVSDESHNATANYADPADYFAVDAVGLFSNGSISLVEELDIELSNSNQTEMSFKILLEGPYQSGGMMETSSLILPNTQPYDSAPYNHSGNETVSTFSSDVIDWVLVEARLGNANATGDNKGTTVFDTRVGLLLENGNIVDPSTGSSLRFSNLARGISFYYCVRHRNHLDVLTSKKYVAGYPALVDLTKDDAKVLGEQQLKPSGDGYFMMYTGDFSQDGIIQSTDFDSWTLNPAANAVYELEDANLDGIIQITDYDFWFRNKAKLGIIEVRY